MNSLDAWQLDLIRRLVVAECPLDHHCLARRYPLRISTGAAQYRDEETNIFPLLAGGTGIAIWTHIVAVSRVAFGEFTLRRGNGTPVPVQWVDYCPTHQAYCIHDTCYGVTTFQLSINDLAYRLRGQGKMCIRGGDEFEGFLVGETSERLASTNDDDVLEFFLGFKDPLGNEYLFPISLLSHKWETKQEAKDRIARDETKAIIESIDREMRAGRAARRQSYREEQNKA